MGGDPFFLQRNSECNEQNVGAGLVDTLNDLVIVVAITVVMTSDGQLRKPFHEILSSQFRDTRSPTQQIDAVAAPGCFLDQHGGKVAPVAVFDHASTQQSGGDRNTNTVGENKRRVLQKFPVFRVVPGLMHTIGVREEDMS